MVIHMETRVMGVRWKTSRSEVGPNEAKLVLKKGGVMETVHEREKKKEAGREEGKKLLTNPAAEEQMKKKEMIELEAKKMNWWETGIKSE